MSRIQLALNVVDLDASVEFYSRLFDTAPHKRRPGYANFAIVEPPVKLVLIETTEEARGVGVQGALNHLGVEVDSAEAVRASLDQLRTAGIATSEELNTTCCYAQQDKVWVHDPAGTPWEVYTITDDDPAQAVDLEFVGKLNDGTCCTPASTAHAVPARSGGCC